MEEGRQSGQHQGRGLVNRFVKWFTLKSIRKNRVRKISVNASFLKKKRGLGVCTTATLDLKLF